MNRDFKRAPHCHGMLSGPGCVPWRMESVTFQACFLFSFSHGRNLGVHLFPWLVDHKVWPGDRHHVLSCLTAAALHVCVLLQSVPVLSHSFPLLTWGSWFVQVPTCAWVWPGCHISVVVHLVFWDWVSPWLGTHQSGYTGMLGISCLCLVSSEIANVYHCAWLFEKKGVLGNQT